MARTNTKKLESREARLKTLPQSQRLIKSATIKKKEGRVLTAAEKHAVRMNSEQGAILRLWEKLRTSDEQLASVVTPVEVADPTEYTNSNEEDIQTGSSINNTGSLTAATTTKSNNKVVQRKNASQSHKHVIINQLLKMIEPKFESYIRTPSMSRVVQSMIKHGNHSLFNPLYSCLAKDFVTFATDAYAHFTVNALIRHAPHLLFEQLFNELIIPSVSTLISHKFGLSVLHSVYTSRWCNTRQRQLMIMSINKDDLSVMSQWTHFPLLDQVIWIHPELQRRLLTRLFELSDKLVSQKDAIGYPMVQQLLYTYMQCGLRDEIKELCDTVRPLLHKVVTQLSGSLLTSLVFVLSEAKKRKELIRSFHSSSLLDIATHKYGAPVIARILDYMYDVQILHKYIADDLVKHFDKLINSSHGYLILMHLLTPHDERKRKFLPQYWFEYNLYSAENTKWNQHTWLNNKYEPETVQLCDRAASYSHLNILPFFVSALLNTLRDEMSDSDLDTCTSTSTNSESAKVTVPAPSNSNGDESNSTSVNSNVTKTTNTNLLTGEQKDKSFSTHSSNIDNKQQRRYHLSLLAREVLLVRVREVEYKKRIPLTDAEVLLLQRFAPARELSEIEKKLTSKQIALLQKSAHLTNSHRTKSSIKVHSSNNNNNNNKKKKENKKKKVSTKEKSNASSSMQKEQRQDSNKTIRKDKTAKKAKTALAKEKARTSTKVKKNNIKITTEHE